MHIKNSLFTAVILTTSFNLSAQTIERYICDKDQNDNPVNCEIAPETLSPIFAKGKPGQVLGYNSNGDIIAMDLPDSSNGRAAAWVRFDGSLENCPVQTHCPIIASYNVQRVAHYKKNFYRVYFITPMTTSEYLAMFNGSGGTGDNSGSMLLEDIDKTVRRPHYIAFHGFNPHTNSRTQTERASVLIYD